MLPVGDDLIRGFVMMTFWLHLRWHDTVTTWPNVLLQLGRRLSEQVCCTLAKLTAPFSLKLAAYSNEMYRVTSVGSFHIGGVVKNALFD